MLIESVHHIRNLERVQLRRDCSEANDIAKEDSDHFSFFWHYLSATLQRLGHVCWKDFIHKSNTPVTMVGLTPG